MNKGIAIAGNLIVDYIKYIEKYPNPHTLTTITQAAPATGGLACNCALTLAKLDSTLPLKVIGIVGNDEAGDFIVDEFNAFKSVDTSGITREGMTSYTDVMTEIDGGGRTFFQYRGANSLLAPKHFDFSKIDADILHIGYILLLDALDREDDEYPTAMCRVLDMAQKAGIKTSIDVVSEDGERFNRLVPPALKYTNYCIINEIEASRTTGVRLRGENDELIKENLPKACDKLMDMGVKDWVVLHMPELGCGLSRGGKYIEEASWNIPQGFKKSSVGAGDAFASGILNGIYNGRGLAQCLREAGAIAAYSLSGAGATDAIIPFSKLMAEMEGYQAHSQST